ncbi:Hypothetical protein FKW44_008827 [Caligus rogercresseyi]|uniref:Uncharacterized protein n=1 Tax=Caligus rogercresseyi TaxID=217165 RepID=A0A7T8KGM7_CALRO|nr:Hypothetical protein FKW44_008827 [Caligus rogercresseyi]
MNVDSCPLERILEGFDERTRSATICSRNPFLPTVSLLLTFQRPGACHSH